MVYRKQFRIAAVIMLICAIVFFYYAITHLTASFPWNNTVTYSIYAMYVLIMVILFVISCKKR